MSSEAGEGHGTSPYWLKVINQWHVAYSQLCQISSCSSAGKKKQENIRSFGMFKMESILCSLVIYVSSWYRSTAKKERLSTIWLWYGRETIYFRWDALRTGVFTTEGADDFKARTSVVGYRICTLTTCLRALFKKKIAVDEIGGWCWEILRRQYWPS